MATPDVSQLADEDLPENPFPASRQVDFRVHFAAEAHADIHRHASDDTTVEICGVLVGRVERDDDGPFVRISNTIRCDNATSKFAEVTFTHESWAAINKEMDETYTDLSIVGWYHTHPDFGVFLSDRDCFIHQNFFSGPGQVAHVVDPIRKTEGVFVWREGKPVPCEHFWAGDRIAADTVREKTPLGSPAAPVSQTSAAQAQYAGEPDWLSTLHRVTPFVLLFLLGFLFADWRYRRVTAWERQQIVEGVMREYGYWKSIKPGLGGRLDTLARQLDETRRTTERLATQHIDDAEEDSREDVRKSWKAVLTNARRAREDTVTLRRDYALDPFDEAVADMIRKEHQSKERPADSPKDETEAPPQPKPTD